MERKPFGALTLLVHRILGDDRCECHRGCEYCGIGSRCTTMFVNGVEPEADHIYGRDDNSPEALAFLCKGCHRAKTGENSWISHLVFGKQTAETTAIVNTATAQPKPPPLSPMVWPLPARTPGPYEVLLGLLAGIGQPPPPPPEPPAFDGHLLAGLLGQQTLRRSPLLEAFALPAPKPEPSPFLKGFLGL